MSIGFCLALYHMVTDRTLGQKHKITSCRRSISQNRGERNAETERESPAEVLQQADEGHSEKDDRCRDRQKRTGRQGLHPLQHIIKETEAARHMDHVGAGSGHADPEDGSGRVICDRLKG